MLTPLHKSLLNDFQRDFPLSSRPYQDIANALGVSENDVLSALTELSENHLISRIGPIIPPNQLGVSTLVAMAIPEPQLQAIADKISAYPEVNHNYEREHTFNLWFVVIASNAEHLQAVLDAIELETGYKTMSLPLLDDFFIDLGFKMDFHNA
ncbi:Lrp/AsnC family transcriptional regulator [Methylobacter sp. S3L5C]|uniref:Lrp/AsnC family transcriptional regulator n=1 Tax=Methylobacter sp. S3L5C TaxID=2839024 RepID=UPI001FABF113|nr:Lrp/AsnC family transcriptional regulator [Methylobacter sp. S3L5C]UOA06872.1 Lrp/AsnC family transcriptional regulator [Methylobacter sp. S3L5C]